MRYPGRVGKRVMMTVVGARPQFVKAAAVSRALRRREEGLVEKIVHTGQHYDHEMSEGFFDDLGIPRPWKNLGVGSLSHARQTAEMMVALEEAVAEVQPDVMVVHGDTNSTLAGGLVAAKLCLPLVHIEAGLRSYNRSMPEEVNRVLVDHVSDLLACPTRTAVANLQKEGITRGVCWTGDVMYDAALFHGAQAEKRSRILETLELEPRGYLLATVHRPSNTDDPLLLRMIIDALRGLGRTVVFPVHPRTRVRLQGLGVDLAGLEEGTRRDGDLLWTNPVGYLDMVALEKGAAAILTDSGGVQKEAYFHKVPCVTLREETEWVETVIAGANRLTGADPSRIRSAVDEALAGSSWDDAAEGLYGRGDAADRVLDAIEGVLGLGGARSEQ